MNAQQPLQANPHLNILVFGRYSECLMDLTILFRNENNDEELKAAKRYFNVVSNRTEIKGNSLVIGRYSFLPYFNELCADLKNIKSRPINNFEQFKYISNFDYYFDIEKYTFKTYFKAFEIPERQKSKKFVVKGTTNSKKHQWNTSMFAENFSEAVHIASELMNDSLIGTQHIIFREYEELETLEVGINGLPFANEWRTFWLKDKLIDFGYYWAGLDDLEKINFCIDEFKKNGLEVAQKIANIISEKTNFFVIDMAKTADGRWKCVELNDGNQSGLSLIDENNFYKSLRLNLS